MRMPRLRRLAVTLATSAIALTAIAPAEARPVARTHAARATNAASEWGKFGVQTQYIEPSTKPGDDFDGYVNGKWNSTTEIPADKTRIGAFITLTDLSEQRLKGIPIDELERYVQQRKKRPDARGRKKQ